MRRGFVSFNDSLASRRTGARPEDIRLKCQRRTAAGRKYSHVRASSIGSGFESDADIDCVLRRPVQELVAAHFIRRGVGCEPDRSVLAAERNELLRVVLHLVGDLTPDGPFALLVQRVDRPYPEHSRLEQRRH